jgi:hypothetical protein
MLIICSSNHAILKHLTCFHQTSRARLISASKRQYGDPDATKSAKVVDAQQVSKSISLIDTMRSKRASGGSNILQRGFLTEKPHVTLQSFQDGAFPRIMWLTPHVGHYPKPSRLISGARMPMDCSCTGVKTSEHHLESAAPKAPSDPGPQYIIDLYPRLNDPRDDNLVPKLAALHFCPTHRHFPTVQPASKVKIRRFLVAREPRD